MPKKKTKEKKVKSVIKKDGLWKCPVCEDICICAACRKQKKLPPLGNSLNRINKEIEGKFDSLWDYFIYCKTEQQSKD